MSSRPYLIGIAGPSGAGKTYLARHLAQRLQASHLALDRYYRDLAHLSMQERAQSNFDEPAALEHELLVSHLREIREGRGIEVPFYDFSTHARTGRVDVLEPAKFVILEGLFTLYWSRLRELLDTGVYVEAASDVCLQRRYERDIAERGRTPESVIHQYRSTVAPMAEQYVSPTRAHAHVIVSGTTSVAEGVTRVLEHIEKSSQRAAGASTPGVPADLANSR